MSGAPEPRIGVHRRLADEVRNAVVSDRGVTPAGVRRAALVDATVEVAEPYATLVHQIRAAAHHVDDPQVAAVRGAAGSDRAAFELIMAAGIGAGLTRWDAAARAITVVDDAPR